MPTKSLQDNSYLNGWIVRFTKYSHSKLRSSQWLGWNISTARRTMQHTSPWMLLACLFPGTLPRCRWWYDRALLWSHFSTRSWRSWTRLSYSFRGHEFRSKPWSILVFIYSACSMVYPRVYLIKVSASFGSFKASAVIRPFNYGNESSIRNIPFNNCHFASSFF